MPQYELSLRDYLRIFRKRKHIVIISVIVGIIATVSFGPKPIIIYKASTDVKVEPHRTLTGMLAEEFVVYPADRMESATFIIVGYPIMKKVALRLGMINANSSLEEIDSVVSKLQSTVIDTKKVGTTNIISITATADTAREAMDFANTTAQVYMEEDLLEKAQQYRNARKFIEEQLAALEKRFADVDNRLKHFGGIIKDITVVEMLQDKLITSEVELAELLQTYTDKYPGVMEIKDKIKALKEQLKGFSGQEIELARLKREVDVNKNLYAMLKEKLEEVRISEAQKVSDISILNPAVLPGPTYIGTKGKKTKAIFGPILGLLFGMALAFVVESLDTSIRTIEDVEDLIKLPVLGIVPSISIKQKEERNIFKKIKYRFAPVKKTGSEETYINLIVHYEPNSYAAEAYRNIRTNLKLSPEKKVILITSAGPGEGKTTITTNLGLVFAQKGLKTLLLSSDLRRPALAKIFGLEREPGLHEVITGKVKLEDALKNMSDMMLGNLQIEEIIKSPGIENLWILTSGHLTSNPTGILESPELTNIIRELRERFDIIFLDSPPVLPITDASLLAAKVDSIILCYEIGRTSRDALLRAKIQLESVGTDISGVILNHTRPQSDTAVAYPYYYYYYKHRYYGREEKKGDTT